jgi:hypothetical protein
MILRVLNFIVIGSLVLAAAYVYRVKFNSTVQAEHLAKLRSEVRHERDSIAALRAQWGELDNPARIEALAKRFLRLKPITPTQFDTLDDLPDRPPEDARTANDDPIGGMIGNLEEPETVTGSLPASTLAVDPAAQGGQGRHEADRPSEAPLPVPAANSATSPADSGAANP